MKKNFPLFLYFFLKIIARFSDIPLLNILIDLIENHPEAYLKLFYEIEQRRLIHFIFSSL